MKTGHYVFVVGIVGAIIAGGYSLGQVVDISSFEVLPEAEAHDGVSGTTGDYFKYAGANISSGYYKTISVRCDTGDKATGFMDYHRSTMENYLNWPWWGWDSSLSDYYIGGMSVSYHNTASYNDRVFLYVFCAAR